jgi:hypothetical protein
MRSFLVVKLSLFAACLAGAILFGAMDARAADTMPTKAAPPATNVSTPAACTNPTDFFTSNCQLSWYGITIFGIVDTGVGWQSHGTPFTNQSLI